MHHDPFLISYLVSLVVCTIFLPTAAKLVNNFDELDGEDRGICGIISIIPYLNVAVALFSIVVCVGKFINFLYKQCFTSYPWK